jgi:hypothetical protein
MNQQLKYFETDAYGGVWIPFNGNRFDFRKQVESILITKMGAGTLQVDERGPHWMSAESRLSLDHLSYSHSANWGICVWIRSGEQGYYAKRIGVDVESLDRKQTVDMQQSIADRMFHPEEWALGSHPFLDYWMKLEAYSKMTRQGLAKVAKIKILLPVHQFDQVPDAPDRMRAWVCLG